MNRLKELREDNDLKQKDISLILKISREIYSQYETERYNISNDNLRKISKFYNKSVDYILYRTDNRLNYKQNNLNCIGNYNRLKHLRSNVYKTQKDIALDLVMPLRTYIQYENKSRSLNIQLLHTFANYFNTSIDYIIGLTDETKPHEKSIVEWNTKTNTDEKVVIKN